MLDTLSLSWYKAKVEAKFYRFRREEFQSWFSDIMERAYPSDFHKIRLSKGDRGCDGYRISTQTVYQVYAPRKASPSELNGKIIDDFNKAIVEFEGKISSWVFVHNDPDGLASETVIDTLGDLNKNNPTISIITNSFNEIWDVVKSLDRTNMLDLFGEAPTLLDMRNLQLEAIVPVLKYIEGREVPSDPPIDPPSEEKLKFNNLSNDIQEMLKLGRRKEILVENYFANVLDPLYGERIAQAFREKYCNLKATDLTEDEIFDELRRFTGGDYFCGTKELSATLAVLSYFFERCDIFENLVYQ